MLKPTYAYTPIEKMFDKGDVYGIGFDEERYAKQKIRLGIAGFGGVSLSKHIPAIARLKSIWEPIELVAVCNRNPQSGVRAKEIYGANWYQSIEDMLENEELDGVIVCSPDQMHYEHTMACLNKGIHVLVEKPIADSLEKAYSMCQKAKQEDLILMTVSNKRYSPPYFKAKSFIDIKIIENPSMFIGKFNLGYDYVNILEDGTIHMLDLMRYFMGDIQSVTAIGTKKYDFNKTGYPFDNCIATFVFESGSIGSVYMSNSALSLKPWEMVEIYGEKKWLKVDDQYTLFLYDEEEGPTKSWSPVMPNTLFFDEEFGGFMGLIENFANCIRGLEQPLVSGYDGYKAYELACGIHLAVALGEKIQLPLDIKASDMQIRQILKGGTYVQK